MIDNPKKGDLVWRLDLHYWTPLVLIEPVTTGYWKVGLLRRPAECWATYPLTELYHERQEEDSQARRYKAKDAQTNARPFYPEGQKGEDSQDRKEALRALQKEDARQVLPIPSKYDRIRAAVEALHKEGVDFSATIRDAGGRWNIEASALPGSAVTWREWGTDRIKSSWEEGRFTYQEAEKEAARLGGRLPCREDFEEEPAYETRPVVHSGEGEEEEEKCPDTAPATPFPGSGQAGKGRGDSGGHH